MPRIGQIYRNRLVSTVKDGLENNSSVFLVNYTHLSSAKMDALRKDLKKVGADVYVSKKRLVQIALKEANYGSLAEKLAGQSALIWSRKDPAVVAKLLLKFAEGREGFLIQGGMLEKAVIDKNDVKRISELPSREVLLSQLLQVMLSPLTSFAGILNTKSRDLLSILKQLSEKKGGS